MTADLQSLIIFSHDAISSFRKKRLFSDKRYSDMSQTCKKIFAYVNRLKFGPDTPYITWFHVTPYTIWVKFEKITFFRFLLFFGKNWSEFWSGWKIGTVLFSRLGKILTFSKKRWHSCHWNFDTSLTWNIGPWPPPPICLKSWNILLLFPFWEVLWLKGK